MTPPQSGELQFDELAYWKRRVAQSSVYGVDLNPLAVDLAKLSLWLITAAKDRPLSFLDHHLRPGNALVGARLNDLTPAFMRKKKAGAALATEPEKPAKRRTASKLDRREKIGQLTFAADSSFIQQTKLAVGNMWLIEESAATTVAEVKQQEKLYAASREAFIRKYSRLADLVTATYFGLEVDESLWTPLADFASGRTITTLPKLQQWLEQADALAEQYRYFHWELEFPEVFFDRFGRPLGEEAGFDVVVGNPPYVRQELLAPFKPYFQTHFASYHGVADLYVYFYERGYGLLQQGGRMSYIVTNKWMRAGYGAPLRSFFADSGALERIIDFGHAPIFADADVFPCILVLERPTADAERQVHITEFPREALHRVDLDRYVRENRHQVPHHRFTAASWSLEPAAVDDLIQRIRVAGQPLLEVVGGKPFRGIMTGLNEAFLIDAATKERLVRLDANAQAIIRPYLRGQDIKRWVPSWQQLWMIVLRSSGDHAWPWSAVEDPEVVFAATYPSIYAHLKPLEDKLRKRQDKGRNWWELRSCAYYDTFEKAKLVYQEIQFHPSYCLDTTGFFSNNKVFMLPTEDRYLLAVLNSPLIWWYNWRYLPHMKDEALSPLGELMERLPIAQPTEQIREQVEPRVDQLLALTAQSRQTANDFIDWLRVEFGVESPSQKLLAFATLEQTAFLDEVRKGRPKSASRLSPAALREVREAFDRYGPEIQGLERERQTLEGRVSDLVNAAYGLTEVELTVLWGTAPPRMPGGRH